jgi:hypothetical protein
MNLFGKMLHLLEGPEEDEIRKRKAEDVKSGRMTRLQRVARLWSKAQRRGKKKLSANLLKHYKDVEGTDEN